MNVRIRRLAHNADLPLPARQTAGSAGFDVMSAEPDLVLQPGERRAFATGLVFEIPDGLEMQVRPRSGLGKQGVNIVLGTIDADYRGEVLVSMYTFGSRQSYRVNDGDRIAQLVISRLADVDFVEASELTASGREGGGHGSTGR